MAKSKPSVMQHNLAFFIFFTLCLRISSSVAAAGYPIGVNYGTVADNLPEPSKVANFLKTETSINQIKIFDANPEILRAFASTGISVTVTVANDAVVSLAKLPAARSWISSNILPFYPKTTIRYIAVGNEVLATGDKGLIAHTLPAMKSLKNALLLANITDIHVSTPHSLGILTSSDPPSSGKFRRVYDKVIIAPILEFHRSTNSAFMVNPYPYFGFRQATLNYALFKPNPGVFDNVTGKHYTNMFDAQLDAVYSAMKKLKFGDVEIMVAETGWPSAGDPGQAGVNLDAATSYNRNLVKHVNSKNGTPLMPNRTFQTFIFELFNENLKGSVSERNFGLFQPDLTAVYDVGVLLDKAAEGPTADVVGNPPASSPKAKKWCLPKLSATDKQMQSNIDYACGKGIDCSPIQPGGTCFTPNTVRSHASFAMNAYYQSSNHDDVSCYFNDSAELSSSNPSYGGCIYQFEGVRLQEKSGGAALFDSHALFHLIAVSWGWMMLAM